MLTAATFQTFHHAYGAVLRHVLNDRDYVTAGRGKDAWESTNISFRLTDPADRVPYLAARRANIVFNHAEALWYLAGRDDLDMIAYYAPGLRKLSADGERLTGTAYGPRLFAASEAAGCSQFDRVLDLLRADPDSKRAALLIMQPDELLDPTNPDVACTLGLQLMLRNNRLHMSAYMRGNDAVIGLLGDTFAFTFIQEFAARLLGVEVGTYTHHVGSMHINVLDLPQVAAMIAEYDQAADRPAFPVEVMPPATSWADLHTVFAYEEALRTDMTALSPAALARVPLHPYWRRVLRLFEVYRQIVHEPDHPVDADTLASPHPGHRWLIEHRWPDRMPAAATAVRA
ncbi:MAG TPA: thymidylate synthase [Micromonosporaceae bacterium]|nr:thymidylate synthase [Micromonosporaceae bacterium]